MDISGQRSAFSGEQPPSAFGHFPQIRESTEFGGREVLRWCVYAGVHPNRYALDAWLMLFNFPNGLQASVVYGRLTNGIEVGVMDGEWLIDVFDDLSGAEVVETLVKVMQRSGVKCQVSGVEMEVRDV